MPQHHTTADQVVFVSEWFRSWSELQRSDFLQSLVQELTPSQHINGGLPEHMHALSIATNRPPSIFHCQVKLFHDWACGWGVAERDRLLQLIRDADARYGDQVDKALASATGAPRGQQDQEQQAQQQNHQQQEHELQHEQELQHQQLLQHEQQQEQQEPQQPLQEEPPEQPGVAVARAVPPEIEVDEALDSSSSSTLSSPRPPHRHTDSGLDSPIGGEVEEVEHGEDEGGHAVVMDGCEEDEGQGGEDEAAVEGDDGGCCGGGGGDRGCADTGGVGSHGVERGDGDGA